MSGYLPQCIFFDLDGTLLDSLPGIEFSVREAFNVCKLPLRTASLQEIIGPPIRTILSLAGNLVDESSLDTLERAFRASYDCEGWQKTVCFPEAPRVLQMMHEAGYRLFIVSNKPRHISLRILEREQLVSYFEAIITRDSRSPNYGGKEEMIEALLAEHSIAKDRSMMVGDTTEDAKAAAAAGINFLCMTHGYGNIVDLHSFPVACSLNSFSELFPLITKEPVCD